MKTPLTKNLIIKHVGESAVILGNEYPYPEARPIILEAIQGLSEPPTLLCWTGKGYERLMPIADISDPTNITGCALKFDSTLDYIDVYKIASIDPDRLDVSDGKLIGAEFAYEGRADVNDTQALLLSFGSEGGADIVVNPETEEGAPVLSSIGINGTDYDIKMPFDEIVDAVNRGIEFGAISTREVVVSPFDLKTQIELLVSDEITEDEDRYPVGVPDKTTKFTSDMTYNDFKDLWENGMQDEELFSILFSLGDYADPSAYGEVGRYWNVYINDVLVQKVSSSDQLTDKLSASGVDLMLVKDGETGYGEVKVGLESGYEYIKYVTLSVLAYGKELVPNFPDEEM